MSNINKQARDKLKSAAAKSVDNFDPNMFVETRDVLALLDELEEKDKRLNEILTPNMLLPVTDDMDEDNLRHVIKTVCENYSLLHAKWEAAEKRIAELEAREVVLPNPPVVKYVSGEFIHCWPAYIVDSAIRAAGIITKVGE